MGFPLSCSAFPISISRVGGAEKRADCHWTRRMRRKRRKRNRKQNMEEGNTRKGGAPRLSPEAKNENEKEEEEEGKQEEEDENRKGGAPTLSPDAVASRR